MVCLTQLILFAVFYNAANAVGPQQIFLSGNDQENVEVFWEDLDSSPGLVGHWAEPSQAGGKWYSKCTNTLNFDDLPAKTALSPISTYKNMSFTSFHLLNVPLAINTSLIAPEDKAAAASPPNALFGSRSALSQSDSETKEAAFPRIFVSPSYSSSSSTPFHQKFILHSFIIKPLGYIPKGRWAKFQIRAFDLEGETSKGALLFFGGDNGGEGFVSRSFQLWLTPWGPMNVLEIKATEGIPGGEDGGDWEFAFDDLVVEILEEEKGEEEKMEVGLDRDEV